MQQQQEVEEEEELVVVKVTTNATRKHYCRREVSFSPNGHTPDYAVYGYTWIQWSHRYDLGGSTNLQSIGWWKLGQDMLLQQCDIPHQMLAGMRCDEPFLIYHLP